MAWKRKPKKVGSACEFDAVSTPLLIRDCADFPEDIRSLFRNASIALVSDSLDSALAGFVEERSIGKVIYLHAHNHPRCVLTCVLSSQVPKGTIITNQLQRVNQKVCLSESETFYVYRGETFSFDAREASIGDTQIRNGASLKACKHAVLEIKEKEKESEEEDKDATVFSRPSAADSAAQSQVDAKKIKTEMTSMIMQNIISVEEIFLLNHEGRTFVLRVLQLVPDEIMDAGECSGDIS